MTTIKCSNPECTQVFATDQPVLKKATYTCIKHTPSTKGPAFQSYAHDKRLDGVEPEAELLDENWGMSGPPLSPSQKCPHGVYAPDGNNYYCSVCNPKSITAEIKTLKKTPSGIKIAVLKNVAELSEKEVTKLLKEDDDARRFKDNA